MRISTLLFAVIMSFAISASQAQDVPTAVMQKDQLISTILHHQAMQSSRANKTTTLSERLTGQSYYNITDTGTYLQDTTAYVYLGHRGSNYDFNNMTYSTYTAAMYNTPLVDFLYYPPVPDAHADTIYDKQLDMYYGMLYNPDNTILNEAAISGTSSGGTFYSYDYNTTGNLTRVYKFVITGRTISSDTTGKRYIDYNSSGQIIKDSSTYYISGGWRPYAKHNYYYDDSGHIVKLETYYPYSSSVFWKLYYTYRLNYTPDNKLEVLYTDSGVSPVPYMRDSFSYSSGSGYFTKKISSNWDDTTHSWGDYRTIDRHMNAAGLPDSISTVYDYPSLTVNYYDVYTYDSYDNPVMMYDSIKYSTMSSSLIYKRYYYYETYTGVHDVKKQANSFSLYPNPCANEINISFGAEWHDQLVQLSIVDMNGKIIYQEQVNVIGTVQMPVQTLLPGVYWLSVSDNEGGSVGKEFVKK